jgi:hypothetical protein
VTGTTERLAQLHQSYGKAVRSMLDQAGLVPDALETGLRVEDPARGPELFLTLSWLGGHPDVSAPAGLDLIWSHLTGWAARTALDARPLGVSAFAAPHVLADAVLHLSVDGVDGAWQPDPADRLTEWEHARALDLALSAAAERGLIAW